MKNRIFQKLKQDYVHLGLGESILLAHAEALNAMGVVTEDNLDVIVSSQKSFLENLQKENDKRVSDATAKAKTSARKEFEEELAKKKADDDAKKLEADKRKQQEKELPEWYLKEKASTEKLVAELVEERKTLAETLNSLKEKSEKLEAEKKASERLNFITAKAKELGVPEYRIEEGFSIKDGAEESEITEYLTKVANNIKTQQLPSNKSVFPLADGKPDKSETDAIAKSLVG